MPKNSTIYTITKADSDQRLVFGWASISVRMDGETVIDYEGDIVEPDELENAAYNYVLVSRSGGEEHEVSGVATLIESVVFTPEKIKAMGLAEDSVPVGWWIGFYIHDPEVWERIKDGTLKMFSIEGTAIREEVA